MNIMTPSGMRFQFLIGRLDTGEENGSVLQGWLFQFLIGRLDTIKRQVLVDYLIVFQFLIGRLDTCNIADDNTGHF